MSKQTILASAANITTNYLPRYNGTGYVDSVIFDNGTNVGIGNTNTTYKLDVTGSGRFSGANYLFTLNGGGISRIAGTIGNTSGVLDWGLEGIAGGQLFTGAGAYSGNIGTSSATSFNLCSNSTVRATITSSGSLGIGNTNPYSRLDVRGGGISQTTTDFSAGSVGTIVYMRTGTTTGNTFGLIQVGNTGDNVAGNLVLNQFGGNVGIGTTSPQRTFDARGTVNLSTTAPTVGSTSGAYADVHLRTYNVYPTAQAKIVVVDFWTDFYSTYTDGFRWFNWDSAGTTPVERMRITSGGIIYGLNSGVDGTYQPMIGGMYSSNNNETNLISTSVSSVASLSGFRFDVSNGAGSTGRTTSMTINRASVTIVGSLSKGSGSFKIDHPLESMKDTHHLVHSFVESPQANNIYRGKVQLVNGKAEVNLDEVSTMTEGTFVLLNREIHTYTSNETDWDAVRGKVDGNILTIECQNNQSNAMVSWLVIGERQDKHMMDTEWTDDNGKVIVEPLKPTTNQSTY